MKCTKVEKWISDEIDGALSEKRAGKLEAHFVKCPSCRSYKQTLERIHGAVLELEGGEVSGSYWEEFPTRIRQKAESLGKEKGGFHLSALGWKWALAGTVATTALIIVLSVVYVKPKPSLGIYAFSSEDSLEHVYREIGDNGDLENILDIAIIEAVGMTLEAYHGADIPGYSGITSIWDTFNDEEIKLLVSEMQPDNKS